jgi:hypothetical protein
MLLCLPRAKSGSSGLAYRFGNLVMGACGMGDYSVPLWLRRITFAWMLLCIISMTKVHTSCQLVSDHGDVWIPEQLAIQEML